MSTTTGTGLKTDMGTSTTGSLNPAHFVNDTPTPCNSPTVPPPRHVVHGQEEPTLRDKFAIAALVGLICSPDCHSSLQCCAEDAYRYADAMLEARHKPLKE